MMKPSLEGVIFSKFLHKAGGKVFPYWRNMGVPLPQLHKLLYRYNPPPPLSPKQNIKPLPSLLPPSFKNEAPSKKRLKKSKY